MTKKLEWFDALLTRSASPTNPLVKSFCDNHSAETISLSTGILARNKEGVVQHVFAS